MNIDYQGITINYELKGKALNSTIKFVNDATKIEVISNANDNKGSIKANIKGISEYDVTINIDFKISDASKLSKKTHSNYVKLEEMTEADINKIMGK